MLSDGPQDRRRGSIVKAKRDGLGEKAGQHRPIMLDVMVAVLLDANPNAWSTRDCSDAMETCGLATDQQRQDFKRGYVAGFLASIGVDRRTMTFNRTRPKQASKRKATRKEGGRMK